MDFGTGTACSGNHALRRFFTNNYTMGPTIAGSLGSSGFSGDGGAAIFAKMNNPSGLASAADAPDGKGGWLIVRSSLYIGEQRRRQALVCVVNASVYRVYAFIMPAGRH